MEKIFNGLVVLVWIPISFMACTSSPNLESYPERQIDRPYTLPDDVATWTTALSATQVDDGQGEVNVSIPFPLIWEQALSDKWTLEYSPLPLGVRYQIANTEAHVLGLRFGSGIGYSSFYGVILQPQIGGYHRYKFGGSYAWESSVSYSRVLSESENFDEWENAVVNTGPMFQLDDDKVITPKIGLGFMRNDLSLFEEYRDYSGDDEFSFYVPASVNFRWLFHRQWEYSLGYSVNSLVLDSDRFPIHSLTTSFKHFW